MKKLVILSAIILLGFGSWNTPQILSEGTQEADTWTILIVKNKQFEPGSSGGMCSSDIPATYAVFGVDERGHYWKVDCSTLYGATNIGDKVEVAWRQRGYCGRTSHISAYQVVSWRFVDGRKEK